jgi:AraC family transcriptional regulator
MIAGRRREARHGVGELDYVTIRLAAPANGVEYEGFTNRPDPLIRQLAVALREEARGGLAAGRLFVDAVATTLALHLLRRYSDRTPVIPSRPAGLTGTRLRRVVEYIAAHLDDDLRLDRLAGLAGSDLLIADIAHQVGMSSQSHLTTVFRKHIGDTPHAYRKSHR